MKREPIDAAGLAVRSHHLWAEQWMLLCAGDFEQALAADGNARGRYSCLARETDTFKQFKRPFAGGAFFGPDTGQAQGRPGKTGVRSGVAAYHYIFKHAHGAKNLGGLKCSCHAQACNHVSFFPGNN